MGVWVGIGGIFKNRVIAQAKIESPEFDVDATVRQGSVSYKIVSKSGASMQTEAFGPFRLITVAGNSVKCGGTFDEMSAQLDESAIRDTVSLVSNGDFIKAYKLALDLLAAVVERRLSASSGAEIISELQARLRILDKLRNNLAYSTVIEDTFMVVKHISEITEAPLS